MSVMVQRQAELFSLADRLVELRRQKADLEERLKDVNAQLEDAQQRLAAQMLEEELQNFVRGSHQFYLKAETYVSAVAERKPDLIAYLRANGAGDLVQETVHPRTLSGYVKEILDESGELPEGLAELVHVYERNTVGVRRAPVRKGE